jgi:3-oxoacyl-[acyl-carrier-protein] synthase II
LAVNLSACAAGTQALGEAFVAIRDGVLDAAVAGGYDSMVNPLGVGGFCLLDALSKSNHRGAGASRPFDAKRDGFVLGEGAGMCVLEELGAARRRGARIYAEILGYGSSLDAFHVADPAPDHAGAVAAMRKALASAGLGPEQIDYVNAHGTGTRKNDPMETRAIRTVLGAAADRVPVSSTKSQIGHLIGAAGAVELIAGLFALAEQILPATINLSEPDPTCDLDYVPNVPRAARIRTFLSNSFGFGGQNASIVARAGEDATRRET